MSDQSPEHKSEGMRFYALQVRTGYEKKVTQLLEHMIASEGIEDQIGRILDPSEEVLELKGGEKRKVSRRFFPGYMLIEMQGNNDELFHRVRAVNHVVGFVGARVGSRPRPLTQVEVDRLVSQVEESVDQPKPKMLFAVGEMVRVKQAPFDGFNGVVQEVDLEKGRLKVAVLIFGRSTPIDLEFTQVEKIST